MSDYTKKEIVCSVNLETGMEIRFMESSNGFKQFKSHWHDYMEFIYVTKGSMHVTLDEEKFTLHENEVLIVSPQQLHAGIPSEEGVSIYSIFLDINALANKTYVTDLYFKPILTNKTTLINTTSNPEIISIINELISSNKNHNPLYTYGNVYRLLGLVFEISNFVPKNTLSKKMEKILEYLQKNYTENISSKTICNKFGYTESHLCRLFKNNMGITISKYIRILRVEHAKKLLQESDLEISKIVESCGFTDFSYFSHCFKTIMHCTPTQFREKIKSKNYK